MVIAIKGSYDVSVQIMDTYAIDNDLWSKFADRSQELEILWDQFKGLASKKNQRFSLIEGKRENQLLACIFFEKKRQVAIWIINLGICI